MADETIRPAMNAAEWRMVETSQALAMRVLREAGILSDSATPQMLAAVLLHGQPFGFTQEDVDELRAMAAEQDEENRDLSWTAGRIVTDPAFLRSLADRLASLLPPAPEAR